MKLGLSGANAPDPNLFPATAFQARCFEQERRLGPSTANNVAVRWRIDGTISDLAVQRALQALVKRHEILRTRLVEHAGQVLQSVAPALELRVQFEDLQGRTKADRDQELERIGRAEALRLFELGSAPLMRALFVRFEAHSAVLHLSFHQAVVDGWSLDILMRELGMLAAACDAGTALVLPQVDLQYGDYARWQDDMRACGGFDEDRDYWRTRLEGVPRFELPPDIVPSAAGTAARSEIRSRLLPKELSTALETSVHASGHTLFTLALASLCAVLERATAAGAVTLSTQVAGRDSLATESVVGPMLNSLVLHLETHDDPTLSELAERASQTLEDALAHQGMPFELLIAELGASNSALRSPLASVNFILQKAYIATAQVSDTEYGAFKLVAIPAYPAGTVWDLNFFMVGREEGWRISCEADPTRYSVSCVERLLEHWQAAMQLLAAAPGSPLSKLAGALQPADATARQPVPLRPVRSPRPARVARTNPRLQALMERIIPIRAEGSQTPVLVLNNTAVLYALSQALGDDRPLFDLQLCPAAEPQKLPYRDFRDHARDAVEMIRLCRPHGPYILMGLCVFGALAIEAARQLRAEGETVELVVLNDSWAPGYREDMPWHDRKIRAWQVRNHNVRLDLERIRAGKKTVSEFVGGFSLLRRFHVVELGVKLGVLDQGTNETVMSLENRWFTEHLLAAQSQYRAEPYPGDVLVFRSEEPLTGRLFARDLGWKPIVKGRLEVLDCPGEHAEMYRAVGSEAIAQGIRQVLGE